MINKKLLATLTALLLSGTLIILGMEEKVDYFGQELSPTSAITLKKGFASMACREQKKESKCKKSHHITKKESKLTKTLANLYEDDLPEKS